MFTNSDFKIAFGLTIIGTIAATTLILVNKCNTSVTRVTLLSLLIRTLI